MTPVIILAVFAMVALSAPPEFTGAVIVDNGQKEANIIALVWLAVFIAALILYIFSTEHKKGYKNITRLTDFYLLNLLIYYEVFS